MRDGRRAVEGDDVADLLEATARTSGVRRPARVTVDVARAEEIQGGDGRACRVGRARGPVIPPWRVTARASMAIGPA